MPKPPQESPAVHLSEALNRLVSELAEHHEATLALMDEKQQRLRGLDGAALRSLEPKQQASAAQLQKFVRRRGELLAQASESGLEVHSLREIALHLPATQQAHAVPLLDRAEALAKSVRHRCLTNWVLGQRALLHTNQLLGILAGSDSKATYGQSSSGARGGTLIDQAV